MTLSKIKDTLRQLPAITSLAKALRPRPMTTVDCLGIRVEDLAQRHAQRSAVIFEGRELNWAQLNAEANRIAHGLKKLGMVRGDCAALIMENRIEFLSTLIALNKLGVIAALINTNLVGRSLSHCMQITDARWCLFGEERLQAVAEIQSEDALKDVATWLFVRDGREHECPEWATDLAQVSAKEPTKNPADTR